MKTCLIISGGSFCALTEERIYDYVIACDHGYEHAKQMGIVPDLVLGDFDSMAEPPAEENVRILRYPVKKDDSDTMIAVKYALQEGFTHLILSCALGGRLDHMLANIQAMAYAAKRDCVAELYGEGEYIRTFTGGRIELPRRDGYVLSLFALSDSCVGLTVEGAVYNVSDSELTNTFPLGLSNGWKDDIVKITMEQGILLIVESALQNDQVLIDC